MNTLAKNKRSFHLYSAFLGKRALELSVPRSKVVHKIAVCVN